MNTRSAISLITEGLQLKQTFANNLEYLVENYSVTDNVFCCDKDGELQEPDHGYFGSTVTYASLQEAMKDMNIYTQGIRVHNDLYTLGNLYENLSDVKEEVVIDLKNSVIL